MSAENRNTSIFNNLPIFELALRTGRGRRQILPDVAVGAMPSFTGNARSYRADEAVCGGFSLRRFCRLGWFFCRFGSNAQRDASGDVVLVEVMQIRLTTLYLV